MTAKNMQNEDMNLVLSSDAKSRLKWTPELHQRFVDGVAQLGGADKATPKSLMRLMGIEGLTLYHLKSHLQKYRLGKSQISESCIGNDQEEYKDSQSHSIRDHSDGTQNQIDESLQIAQALQMQMEAQKKLHEQIEVQRHLQLRIEAQGKYLQSVLKKAQDTLSGYDSSTLEVEMAKAELSQLLSMVDNGCSNSSLRLSTDIRNSIVLENKPLSGTRSSLQSSLTSSGCSIMNWNNQQKRKTNDDMNTLNSNSALLLLMEMHPEDNSGLKEQGSGIKRSGSTTSDGNNVMETSRKKSTSQKSNDQMRKCETLDLNIHLLNDLNPGPKTIDLNCKEVEQSNELLFK